MAVKLQSLIGNCVTRLGNVLLAGTAMDMASLSAIATDDNKRA